jgi:hypothetical protein
VSDPGVSYVGLKFCDMSEKPRDHTDRRWIGVVVWTLCVLALFAVPTLLYRASAALPWLGPPTRHDLDSRHYYLVAAAAVAVATPALGLAAAVWARRRVLAGVMTALLALASGVVLLGLVDNSPDPCQSYGGGTHCPQD